MNYKVMTGHGELNLTYTRVDSEKGSRPNKTA